MLTVNDTVLEHPKASSVPELFSGEHNPCTVHLPTGSRGTVTQKKQSMCYLDELLQVDPLALRLREQRAPGLGTEVADDDPM